MVDTIISPPLDTVLRPVDETTAAERSRRVGAAIATMRTGTERPLTLDELADVASYSRFHFVRTFRELTGTTPGAFQTAIRFARASELLLTSDASVTEICGDVGYSSLGTFSDRFRSLVGVSPSGLRELPHRIAGLPSSALEDPAMAPADARQTVRVLVPETGPGAPSVYVGLFPDAVASGFPVSGAVTRRPGILTLTGVPPGRYHLLAAAFPTPIDGLGHLLPGDGVLVSSIRRPIRVASAPTPGHPPPLHHLALRPIVPTDAPILTALPALVLARLA